MPYRVCRFTATTPFPYYFRCLAPSKCSYLEGKRKKMGSRAAKCLAFVGTYRALVHIENRGKTRLGLISVACQVNSGGYSRTETNVCTREAKTYRPTRTQGESPFFLAISPNRSWCRKFFTLEFFTTTREQSPSANLIFKEDLNTTRQTGENASETARQGLFSANHEFHKILVFLKYTSICQ